MKILLSLVAASVATSAALLVPIIAHAQPRPPGLNPGAANAAAQRSQQNDILYWYNLLPPQIFGAFGNVDRLELLQGKDAVYDKNRGFIEVMAPGDPNQNDVEKLQVKLYRGNQGLMAAVSQVVWNQPRVKGALAFFALGNDGQLMDVTKQVFPYDLMERQGDPPNQGDAPANNGTGDANAPATGDKTQEGAAPINADLSARGTTIETGVPETKTSGAQYVWNNQTFVKRESNRNDAPAQDEQQ